MCIPQVLDQSFFSCNSKEFRNVSSSHLFDVDWPAHLIDAVAAEVEVLFHILDFRVGEVIENSIKIELLAHSHKI